MKQFFQKAVSLFVSLSFLTGLCTVPHLVSAAEVEKPSITVAWPGGKLKALTGSFDDGTAGYANEKWLVDTFNANGIKATFALPSGNFAAGAIDNYKGLYAGHEVASHTKFHSYYGNVSPARYIDEIKYDMTTLAPIAPGGSVQGIAYPNGGSPEEEQKALMKEAGIVYGRSTCSTRTFNLPDDLYNWNPTCFQYNINDLEADAAKFIALSPDSMKLMYVWGHSYQLNDSNKPRTQAVYQSLGGRSDIYFGTNIEIANYLTASKELMIGADENGYTTVYNPSGLAVWILVNGQAVEIPAGTSKTIYITQEGQSISFNDPCEADPNGKDKLFFARENGIAGMSGDTTITDSSTGNKDYGYTRWDTNENWNASTIKGKVHALIYKVSDESYDISAFNLLTYKREGSTRVTEFHIYTSPDNTVYTEVNYNKTQVGDRNNWYLYRYDLTNAALLPAGTKYIKIAFPTDFEKADNDDKNGVVLGHVNLTFSKAKTVHVDDASPAAPTFVTSSIQDGAQDVSLATDGITLVFNKVMDAETVNTDTISIDNGLGVSSVTPLDSNKTYRVAFDATVQDSTAYTVSLSGGIKAADGTAIAPAAIRFTTKDLYSGTVNDTATDYRYAFMSTGSHNVALGVDGDDQVNFARTAADTATATSSVIYRAPFGEITSVDVDVYRHPNENRNPFTLYVSKDNITYTKLMDETDGVTDPEPAAKWCFHNKMQRAISETGIKYLKVEFPKRSENDGASHHLAQIGNVRFNYSVPQEQRTSVGLQNLNVRAIDAQQNLVSPVPFNNYATSISAANMTEVTTGKATVGVEVVNFQQQKGAAATVYFALYKDDRLEKLYPVEITCPAPGESVFVRREIASDETVDITGCTLKCFVWENPDNIRPLDAAIVF